MTEKKKTTKEKDKKWIKKAVKNPGAFTAKAKRKGITSAQLQANIEKNMNSKIVLTPRNPHFRLIVLVQVNYGIV